MAYETYGVTEKLQEQVAALQQQVAALEAEVSLLSKAPNTASPKLPLDIVEGFHALLAKHRSNMWSSEQHIMDQVASFIGR